MNTTLILAQWNNIATVIAEEIQNNAQFAEKLAKVIETQVPKQVETQAIWVPNPMKVYYDYHEKLSKIVQEETRMYEETIKAKKLAKAIETQVTKQVETQVPKQVETQVPKQVEKLTKDDCRKIDLEEILIEQGENELTSYLNKFTLSNLKLLYHYKVGSIDSYIKRQKTSTPIIKEIIEIMRTRSVSGRIFASAYNGKIAQRQALLDKEFYEQYPEILTINYEHLTI